MWLEPYLRPYIDEIDVGAATDPDGIISVDDYEYFLSNPQLTSAAELPEFIRLAILEGIGLISDRGQLERLLAYLQWGGVILSAFISPAGGLTTTLGKLIFSAAMVVSAAEAVVSYQEGDDLGVVFAAAGVIFDSLQVAALAADGLKAAATGVTVGADGLRLDDILIDLSDDASMILGDAMAAGPLHQSRRDLRPEPGRRGQGGCGDQRGRRG